MINHQRLLKKRGYKDAYMVSKSLNIKGFTAHLEISSDAIRTKNTAEIFISNLNMDESLVRFLRSRFCTRN